MEKVKLEDLDPAATIVLDAHLLKTFRACEKKFWWFEEQHVIPKLTKSAPAFGIAMHEAIAALRLTKRDGRSYNDSLRIGQDALLEAYKKHMPPEALSDTLQDDARSPKNALRIFTGYAQHYEPSALRFHHVEVPFAMFLGTVDANRNKDVIYTGIIDAVYEMHSRLYVNDIKTTGWNIDQKWLDGFKMDQGLLGYMIAAKTILGVDTNYASVHAIWVKAEAKNPSKAKPLDEYFHTAELYWDQEQVDEWTLNTLNTAQVIDLKRQDSQAHWTMDFGQNCGAFGGCDYRSLCATTPKARDAIQKLDYEKAIWRPLEDERLQKIE